MFRGNYLFAIMEPHQRILETESGFFSQKRGSKSANLFSWFFVNETTLLNCCLKSIIFLPKGKHISPPNNIFFFLFVKNNIASKLIWHEDIRHLHVNMRIHGWRKQTV